MSDEVNFTPIVKEEKQVKLVELTLSKKEANVLWAILSKVQGKPETAKRHTDAVMKSLEDVTDKKTRDTYAAAITGTFTFLS